MLRLNETSLADGSAFFDNFLSLSIGVIFGALCMASFHATAEPFVVHNGGQMVLDKATGLVWRRCDFGQTWDGRICAGDAKKITFDEARALRESENVSVDVGATKLEWVVPTARQLVTLVYCGTSFESTVDLADGEPPVSGRCKSRAANVPLIDLRAFPRTQADHYWSSSSMQSERNSGRAVSFYFGEPSYDWRTIKMPVKLVRVSKMVGDYKEFGFVNELTPLAAIQVEEERKQREQQQKAEIEATARRNADERAFSVVLNSKEPQSMYLAAGKYERDGEFSKAREIYERLISRFSSSSWAVKANDRLLDYRREAAARSTNTQQSSGRGGLARTTRLEVTGGYGVECRSGYSDTLSRIETRGFPVRFCATNARGVHECFESPTEAGLHLCQ